MKKSVITASLLIALVLCIVTSPQIALQAANDGFNVWWRYLFPVLLPMYLLLILCKALGLFHSLSYILIKLLRIPSMTPTQLSPYIFRWLMGSTYIASVAQQTLEQQTKPALSRRRLSYLLSLSYNSNPIFIIVIIFTAFIELPLLGVYIVAALLISTLICVILIRLLISSKRKHGINATSLINELELGRQEDGRSIGKLLGEGIYESVQQLFFIGGVMLFGSVIAAYLQVFSPRHLPINFSFIMEQHYAAYSILKSTFSFQTILLCIAIILSTGGLIQLFIMFDHFKQQQLSLKLFMSIRLIHVLFTLVIIYFSFPALNQRFNFSEALQTFSEADSYFAKLPTTLHLVSTSVLLTSVILLCLLFFSYITHFLLNLYYKNKQA